MTRREKEIALAKALGWQSCCAAVDGFKLLTKLATQEYSPGLYDLYYGKQWHCTCNCGVLGCGSNPQEAIFEAAYEALVKHDKT